MISLCCNIISVVSKQPQKKLFKKNLQKGLTRDCKRAILNLTNKKGIDENGKI